MEATKSISITAPAVLPMFEEARSNSVYCTAETSDEVFSMLMNSLPVGGTITRMAWGRTMRPMVFVWDMPSACAASVWPSSTDWMPARTISAM